MAYRMPCFDGQLSLEEPQVEFDAGEVEVDEGLLAGRGEEEVAVLGVVHEEELPLNCVLS